MKSINKLILTVILFSLSGIGGCFSSTLENLTSSLPVGTGDKSNAVYAAKSKADDKLNETKKDMEEKKKRDKLGISLTFSSDQSDYDKSTVKTKDSFKIGEIIYAHFRTSKNSLAEVFTNRNHNISIRISDGNIWSGVHTYKMSEDELQKKSFAIEIFPNQNSARQLWGNNMDDMIARSLVNIFSNDKKQIKILIYNGESRGSVEDKSLLCTYTLTVDYRNADQENIERQLSAIKENINLNRSAFNTLPEAAMKDPALESKILKLCAGGLGNGEKPLRAVIIGKWMIEKNDLGIILYQSIPATVAFQSKKLKYCIAATIIFKKPYMGGGKYGDISENVIPVQEYIPISKENVFK